MIPAAVRQTITEAVERSHAKDVDEYFFSPIRRTENTQLTGDELMAMIAVYASRFDLRLDYVINDQCRFTKVGNRF